MDYAWNAQEVAYHTGTTDYWVSVRGKVYDLTNFYKLQYVSFHPRRSCGGVIFCGTLF